MTKHYIDKGAVLDELLAHTCNVTEWAKGDTETFTFDLHCQKVTIVAKARPVPETEDYWETDGRISYDVISITRKAC